jgi:hypothetical protein
MAGLDGSDKRNNWIRNCSLGGGQVLEGWNWGRTANLTSDGGEANIWFYCATFEQRVKGNGKKG